MVVKDTQVTRKVEMPVLYNRLIRTLGNPHTHRDRETYSGKREKTTGKEREGDREREREKERERERVNLMRTHTHTHTHTQEELHVSFISCDFPTTKGTRFWEKRPSKFISS